MPFLLRILLGALIYALIVVLAAPFPSAAGLMLTFPALNGLAFLFAERTRVPGMARSMLWMPVLNGLLCAGYIVAFLRWAPSVSASLLAWLLTVIVIALWAVAAFRPRVLAGISAAQQLSFVLGATLIGVLAVVAAAALNGQTPLPADPAADRPGLLSWSFVGEVLMRNAVKVALFAVCLAVFLAATRALPLSDGVRGILAGLPFVPFAGLLSIAGDEAMALSMRSDIFDRMAASVWLAPAIAIWFIFGFSRYLGALAPGSRRAVPALIVAWLLCGLAVAIVAALIP